MMGIAGLVLILAAGGVSSQADRPAAYYHVSMGQQARLSGKLEDALAEYRKAQKVDPRSAEIRAETARLLRELGRLEEALAEAGEGVRLDKDSADAHLVLA